MRELISYVVRNLVDDPDSARVREVTGEMAQVFEIRVAREDQGKLIGKQGRTIRSLRSLVSAAGARAGKRAMVEVLD
jgi:predicted RNA-binding protein YlqC (UPF0109 family)